MSVSLILSPEVEQDIGEAYAWYTARRQGLGDEFLSCVDAGIQQICRSPELHAKIYEGYRRALVRRFPYAIFYEHEASQITVYGVLHTSRDPERWRKRLT